MDHGDDRHRHQGDGLDEYGAIEPTSDAVEDVQPVRAKDEVPKSTPARDASGRRRDVAAGEDPEAALRQAPPPDANDELGQHEGSYEEAGITNDQRDDYGTGGGDVGIGGDVSPRGAMHDVATTGFDV